MQICKGNDNEGEAGIAPWCEYFLSDAIGDEAEDYVVADVHWQIDQIERTNQIKELKEVHTYIQ